MQKLGVGTMVSLHLKMLICFPGCLYAIQSKWSIHYGRIGFQFSFYNWWTWICYTGQNKPFHASPKPNSSHLSGIYIHSYLFLYVQSVHEDEITVSCTNFCFALGKNVLVLVIALIHI